MKKTLILISVLLFVAFAASSCTTTSKCAAYNDIHKYQKEVKY